jgi:hypothetical protein
MRRRRLRYTLLGILLSIIVSLVIAAWPGSSTFTVSPETTYVTEPLDKHGYVDYVTALNQRIGKGITPENNANVLIWQAIGPPPEGVTMPSEYFQWLAIECPPDEGEYWISWQAYLKQLGKREADLDRHPDASRADRPLDPPYSPSIAKDPPELASWLERNKKPLTVILEATRRPKYYNPLVTAKD